jgi:hypothetical protein
MKVIVVRGVEDRGIKGVWAEEEAAVADLLGEAGLDESCSDEESQEVLGMYDLLHFNVTT